MRHVERFEGGRGRGGRLGSGALLALVVIVALPSAWAAEQDFEVKPELSRLSVHLYKRGLLKGFGHEHELEWSHYSGTVKLDWQALASATVDLRFEANSLRETNEEIGEDDRFDIERTAKSDRVLDAEQYPEIRFTSTGIVVRRQEEARAELDIIGRLTVRGVAKDLRVPVTVTLDGDHVRAVGSVELKQTDYGIEPVSAALGTVKVKDEMQVRFDFGAQRTAP
jgi:polyisoprenoid-binding protein YceI